VARWQPAVAAVAEATGIAVADLATPSTTGVEPDHLVALSERIDSLRAAIDSLRDWVQLHNARRAAVAAGVGAAVTALDRGDIGAGELATAWERATLLAWADAELAAAPPLAQFHGTAHHAHVSAFADLDRSSLGFARARAVVKLAERIPRVVGLHGVGPEPGGELGTLLHELKKQRGHRPLRALFADIPTLLPRLAPCLLMSPQSVAQYLEPNLLRFDVVVFDEASQLPTEDAIGALARGRSVVVVGDSRQLPPTRFFDVAPDADEEPELVELESVLDDCAAARLPEMRLDWHYRSKHEDLIAFANQRYYDERLQVFPTAHGSPDLGVHWRRIDGVYDRGGTRQNRAEAEAVVADVVARLRDPGQRGRSLAVVTLSRAQQELVEDLLDVARAADPSLDAFFEDSGSDSAEAVLVKNLETIQGDERDVVLLSIGYGPDATGRLTMNFGPLSQRGGERRLNVAITRAREQLVVFSSFAPEDIGDDAPSAIRDLAALVDMARTSGRGQRPSEEAAASPITAAIARALVERGWIVRHQIGAGAFKLDLVIVDPNDPDRYILGIEHDGAMYASASAARDRDRLRAQVLGQLGWRLHRIWSLDWWADPEREILRAHGAIVTALAASRQRRATPVTKSARPVGSAPIGALLATATTKNEPMFAEGSGPSDDLGGTSTPIKIKRGGIAIGPYTVAAIPAGRRAPDDMFAPRHSAELGKVVEQVLAAEAPMQLDLLARRVGAYFGIGRVTQRVTDQVKVALAGRGKWGDEQGVVWRLDQDPTAVPAVRVAGSGAEARRDIDEVPLSEVAAAARIVVERAVGIGPAELLRDTSRLLGFSRITERVTDRVSRGVRLAAQRELIHITDNRVTLPD
jgi:very-short-patch-repair endonuclease